MNSIQTITHISRPTDKKCQWWQAILPNDMIAENLTKKAEFKFLKQGHDHELPEGTLLINSESVHRSKNRGFVVSIGMAIGDKVEWVVPNMKIKMKIKSEGHQDLMQGSGDVAAVIRIALYLARQNDKIAVFKELINIV